MKSYIVKICGVCVCVCLCFAWGETTERFHPDGKRRSETENEKKNFF